MQPWTPISLMSSSQCYCSYFFIHLILPAWRDSDPSLFQALLDANGKRKVLWGGLPLDKGHLYILKHLALPSVTSAGNNLEARGLTELYSAVSWMRARRLSPQKPSQAYVVVGYFVYFIIGRATQFSNKVFSIVGYLKKGENCLVTCKNFPVCDFIKWKELKGHWKSPGPPFLLFIQIINIFLALSFFGRYFRRCSIIVLIMNYLPHLWRLSLCPCPVLPPNWPAYYTVPP